jgi:hypothetical protein
VWKLGLSLMAANVIVFINKTYVKLFSEKIWFFGILSPK